MPDFPHLKTIEQRLLWLSHWMIHHANHIRTRKDAIKIGGHQASSASMVSIPSSTRVRAQSSVSLTEGDFFKSS